MAGRPAQFGVDEEELADALAEIRRFENLDLVGFHIYSGTQCLFAESIAMNFEIFAQIFSRLADEFDLAPKRLVFGAGFGIPYHSGDEALDLTAVARRANPILDRLREEIRFRDSAFSLELGRYLVGESGTYLTRVVGVKQSRGTEFLILDGGMNHHLGACGHLGSVIHRNYPIFRVESEPAAEERTYDLVGPLCTSIDRIGHEVSLPATGVGDLLGVGASGAYGPTASPTAFIAHDPPKEILVETRDGKSHAEDVSFLPSL